MFRIALFLFCFLLSSVSSASILISFSPSIDGGSVMSIEGVGELSSGVGSVIDFYNLDGGDPFSSSIEDLYFDLSGFSIGGVGLSSLRLDSDLGGDDFYLYFESVLPAGASLDISFSVVLEELRYQDLNPGRYTDVTDSEDARVGGFELYIAEQVGAQAVSEPSGQAFFCIFALLLAAFFNRRDGAFERGVAMRGVCLNYSCFRA